MWHYPIRITYSFVPDGTSVGGVPSNLFSTLNKIAPTATWEAAIEQAAAVWESAANIDLSLVPDSGAPLGAAGDQQDDPRFGDIRISMIPQSGYGLAFTNPPPPVYGGTGAGDIVFNSNLAWQINSNYDLESVALHEFGHALGLNESTVQGAAMYAYYQGVVQNLAPDDIAGIDSIYGPVPGSYSSNHTINTAWNLTPNINQTTDQLALANQAILGATDSDFWYVTVPSNTSGTMTVSMQTTNLSSLSPAVIVYNNSKVAIAGNGLPNVYGGTATVTINGVSPGQGYYIAVKAAGGRVTPAPTACSPTSGRLTSRRSRRRTRSWPRSPIRPALPRRPI